MQQGGSIDSDLYELGYNLSMHAFEYILILLIAVLVSSLVSARFPKLPTPLVQIATGIALSVLPLSFEVHLEPELFMVLFIAPLLFEDAKKMDKPSLWRLKYPILLLALGLVIITVLVLGFVLNYFAPSITLAAAFALAAALAPTDAVSVASLKQNAKISDEQNRLLQGESLLNDASSIVSFNFAVAAAITGTFSLWEAEGVLLIKFLGGLVLGVVIMLARYVLLRFLRARGIENASFHVLFEVITPLLVYLFAELIGVSGIIAVVAAGITHSFAPRIVTPTSARLNVVSTSVWSVISFTLNGLVFLMLGTQLPYVIGRVWTGTEANTNFLLLLIVLILLVILALRFAWVLAMRRNVNLGSVEAASASGEGMAQEPLGYSEGETDALSLTYGDYSEMSAVQREEAVEELVTARRQQRSEARSERRGLRHQKRKASRHAAHSDKHYWKHHLFDALLLSLTGVKGAITLALILSIPLTLDGTTPFPERDLLIFLASGVILLSLLSANIILPLIAPKKTEPLHPAAELTAILDIYHKVASSLASDAYSDSRAAAGEVMRQYQNRIATLTKNHSLELPHETNVRRYIISLQQENTKRLLGEGKISALTALVYINSLSHHLAKIEHHNTLRWEFKALVEQFKHQNKMRRASKAARGKKGHADRVAMFELRVLQIENYRYALSVLRELEPTEDIPEHTIAMARMDLSRHLSRFQTGWGRNGRSPDQQKYEQERIAIEARALDLEREAISEALLEGNISYETAKMLRDNVAMMELDIEDQLE